MLPIWMENTDSYVPPRGGGTFAVKTIRSISAAVGKLQFQQGRERKPFLPAAVRLLLLFALILLLSLSRHLLVLLACTAFAMMALAVLPPDRILSVWKSALAAALFAFLVLMPAMLLRPAGRGNNLIIIWKIFISVQMVSIFNHTTQWNHITSALRRLHVPGVFIFTIDISLKYIVLLGRLINDLLTSYLLRAVGMNKQKYTSVGGVMGVVFLRGTEMNRQMYEAMVCRGFTDDYEGL